MKVLRKDCEVVAKRLDTAKKATDVTLRSVATSQDKETLAQIQSYKKKYENLLKKSGASH